MVGSPVAVFDAAIGGSSSSEEEDLSWTIWDLPVVLFDAAVGSLSSELDELATACASRGTSGRPVNELMPVMRQNSLDAIRSRSCREVRS